MPVISVRISEDQRKKLRRHGNVSDTVRRAIEDYLRKQESREVLRQMAELQKKNRVSVDVEEIVKIIREGRQL